MNIKTGLVIAMLTLPTMTSAVTTRSSTILLGGGTAAPIGTAVIPLAKLLDGVYYEINCTLRSNGVSNQSSDMIQFSSNSVFQSMSYTVNGVDVGSTNQAKMPTKTDVNLKVGNAISSSFNSVSLYIRNLDDTDTITISNCVANPSV